MNIITSLVDLGLTEKEAELYLALLPRGQAPASILAKALGQPRSSTRFTLEQMVKKGIISEIEKHATSIYILEDPENLGRMLSKQKSDIEFREKKLEEILKILHTMIKGASGLPKVTYYEGIEDVSEMVIVANNQIKNIYEFGTGDYVEQHYPEIVKRFNERFIKIPNRTVSSIRGNKYRELYKKYKPKVQLRNKFFTTVEEIKTGVTMGENTTIISVFVENDIAGIKIESENITKNLISIFQEVWGKLPE